MGIDTINEEQRVGSGLFSYFDMGEFVHVSPICELELVDSLPRTGLGKIRRSLLVTSGPEQHPHG